MHPLDRPVWSSLITHHAPLSEGTALARRFVPDVNLFMSARDDSAEAVAALADLVKPGESAFILQVPTVVFPPGFIEVKAAKGVQMVLTAGTKGAGGGQDVDSRDAEIVTLTEQDAPEMLALATLTEPGPFLARTHTMGHFRGVRIDGRLAAMAGERMRFPGYTEVSGVCTHPDFRGRGLARRLSAAVVAGIEARGEQAFLHVWKSNHAAISLYEGLGFRIRTDMNATVLRREAVGLLRIFVESPHQTEVEALLRASDAYMAELYPAESNHMIDMKALLRPEVRFIVARDGARAVGCGAIVISPEGWAEVKRMFVAPAARGQKLGRRLIERLEELARENGVSLLRLETGVKQPEALALYRSRGFVEIGPFGAYGVDPLSVFMEKSL